MFLLILYFPLVSCISCGYFGHYLGNNGSSQIASYFMFITLIISFLLFKEVILNNSIITITIFNWIEVGDLNINFELLFDSLSSIMIFIIVLISCCVHWYAIEYMYGDPHLSRFLAYLSGFTFFMLILVTSSNLLQLFLGWEGVGLCSYLLINFWYTRIAANKAAMKAIIINKIGDVTLLVGIIIFFIIYKSLDFVFINSTIWLMQKNIIIDCYLMDSFSIWINVNYITIILFLFIIGACAKSAQIGLHTWLPDAMEGPTPVSALIHAATMVTAGVFLLLRSVHLLKIDENSLLLVSFLGGITAFIAATIGLFQNDIKKIIAYSTCSQLGYMVLSCGLNNYSGSLFHLMNHAFFKALLFLSAGAIIHSMLDQQDVRRMGMLLKYLPVSYIMILIGSLTIMGIPFLTGYYSKDFILEYIYTSNMFLTFFLYWLGIISAALTSFYSIKLLFLTFYNVHNSYFNILYSKKNKIISIHESKYLILLALIILFLGSVFVGYIFKDLFIGMGTDIWINTLDTEFYSNSLKIFEVEFLPIRIKLIPIVFTFISGFLSFIFFKFYIYIIVSFYKIYYIIYIKKNKTKVFLKFIEILFNLKKLVFNGYYFNEIYNFYLYKNKKLSYDLMKNLDKGIIEYISHMFLVNNINKILYLFSKKHSGRIDYFVFTMILGIVVLNFILLLWDILLLNQLLALIVGLILLQLQNNIKEN